MCIRDRIWNEIGFPEADKRSEMAFARLENTLDVRPRPCLRIPAWVRIAAISVSYTHLEAQRIGPGNCLTKTHGYAKWKHDVYSLTPARCWKVKRRCHRERSVELKPQ